MVSPLANSCAACRFAARVQQDGGLDKHKHSMTSCRSTWSCSPASLWCLHIAFRHPSHEYERGQRTEATSLAIRSHPSWRVAVWAGFLCFGWAQSLNCLPKGPAWGLVRCATLTAGRSAVDDGPESSRRTFDEGRDWLSRGMRRLIFDVLDTVDLWTSRAANL
jgi:hypothetical protein